MRRNTRYRTGIFIGMVFILLFMVAILHNSEFSGTPLIANNFHANLEPDSPFSRPSLPDETPDPFSEKDRDSSTPVSSDDLSPITPTPTPEYKPADPFQINGNWTDAVKLKLVSGMGTERSPYIIENFEINASGYNYGILINNSRDVHFIIRNNYIHSVRNEWGLQEMETGQPVEVWPRPAAITLYASQNAYIYDNKIENNYGNGLNLLSTHDSYIANNTFDCHRFIGIYQEWSERNVFYRNTITRDEMGIHARHSSHALYSGNKVSLITQNGIYLRSDRNTTLEDNVIEQTDTAYFIFQANDIRLRNNSGRINRYGLIATHVNGANLTEGNVFNDNSEYGSSFVACTDVLITDSEFNDNDEGGIDLYQCLDTEIIHNDGTMDNNGLYGIHLVQSNSTLIQGNKISNNPFGIYMDSTEGNSIFENTFMDNGEGILDINGFNWIGENYYLSTPQDPDNPTNSGSSDVSQRSPTGYELAFLLRFQEKLKEKWDERYMERLSSQASNETIDEVESPLSDFFISISRQEVKIPIAIFSAFIGILILLNYHALLNRFQKKNKIDRVLKHFKSHLADEERDHVKDSRKNKFKESLLLESREINGKYSRSKKMKMFSLYKEGAFDSHPLYTKHVFTIIASLEGKYCKKKNKLVI